MAEVSNKSVNDFITREDFVEWVQYPTSESDRYWKQFLLDNPSSKADIEEAIFILKGINPSEKRLSDKRLEKLWTSISKKTVTRNRSKKIYIWSVAASVVAILGISMLFYFSGKPENEFADFSSVAKVSKETDDVRLIFSDNSEKTFSTDDLEIKYNNEGEIEVTTENGKTSTSIINRTTDTKNSKQKGISNSGTVGSKEEQLNQLVVPRGKRMSLVLSDGSRLYLNSGSRAVYPVKFSEKRRELFVEGEAYIEVAHDSKRPFIAVTDNMTVRVLGTRFNISAYPEDSFCSVVLVEGNVQAEVNSQQIMMDPNHLLMYQKDTKETSLDKTDVLPYISWKDGWLYCKKEKLRVVADKLSRYYNIKIEFQDEETPEMILYGKLDLKTDCSDIFNAISAITPISCIVNENEIIVSKKRDNN